jgi:hypothetical protein
MLACTPIRDPIVGAPDAEFEVDWESPSGGEEPPFARACLPPYVFNGPGDAHWIGQRCALLEPGAAESDLQAVVLACGCRAQVSRSGLTLMPTKASPGSRGH